MPRLRYLLLPLVAFAIVAGLLGAADDSAPSPLPDPVPIQRLILPPDQLEQQLQRGREGFLEKMTRADFEDLVQKAARAKSQPAPRLLEARYQARLEGDGLVGGGQWKVAHSGDAPGLLNLAQPQPINLALRHVRFENGDALVGEFDGKHPTLLLDRPGEHRIALEWSARGEARPEGLQLELRIPPCPVAVLEIDVAADRLVAPLNGLLLSGPLPAETPERRHWQIACGNRPVVRFLVRKADPPAGAVAPLRLVRTKSVQKIYPEGVEATYELALEVGPYGVRELVCECHPQLRPRQVIVPHLQSWTIQPGPQPNAPAQLVIRLSQPLREGTLQVSCLAPLGSPPEPGGSVRSLSWRSPGLRLQGGVPRGETLDVWLHPDLRMEDWQPGGFRMIASASEEDTDRQVRMQHLTLEGGGVRRTPGQPASTSRPTAHFQAGGAQFRARELAWWRVDGSGMQLTLQIAFEVRHGRLFQLPVQLPVGWEVERVELSSPALLRSTSVRPPRGKERATLLVDLLQPLEPPAPAAPASGRLRPRPLTQSTTIESDLAAPPGAISRGRPTLTITLRPSQPIPAAGAALPFPDAVPVGALFREGVLAIDVDEQVYRARVDTRAASTETEEEGPWGPQPPDHYFRYFGQPVAGTLQLAPRPARIRARCHNEVFVASGGAYVDMRMELEAEVGSPDTIEVVISAPGLDPQRWRDGREGQGGAALGSPVREATRLGAHEVAPYLHVLGAAGPLQAAAVLAACPGGERWRLRLARPLRAREPLQLHTTRHLEVHNGRWLIPLPAVLGANRLDGEVTLHLAGADLVQLEAVGLRESAAEARGAAPAWRTFRYGQPQVSLMLVGQMIAGSRPTEAVLDAARLTTYVGAAGTLQHHFTFQAANWPQRTLPLSLPPGARPLAVGVDGRWLPRLVDVRDGEREQETFELPVPQDSAPGTQGVHRFEVVYTSTAEEGLLWRRARAPLPALPVAPLHLQRRWRLAPELVPLFEGRYQRLPGSGERFAPSRRPRRLTDFFRLAPDLPGPWQAPSREAKQQQLLAEAALSLRNTRAGQKITLRELVEAVALEYLQDRQPLVVDRRALHEAGLSADSELTVPPRGADARLPWEECGLTVLTTPAAILLTSQRQRDAWLGPIGSQRSPALSAPVQQTLAAAVDNGQDPSARFQLALVWLRHDRASATGNAADKVPALVWAGLEEAAWSEWEAIPGQADDELAVVPAGQGASAGLLLTALFCLLFWWLGQRSWRARFLLILVTLASAGLALPWLPLSLQEVAWWPFLAGVLAGLWWYLRWVSRRRRRTAGSVRLAAAGVAAGAGVLLLVAFARTDPAGPATVYLLPGPDAPNKQTALVPAELLTRLRTLARPLSAEGRAVLVNAHYDGKPVQDVAEWSAVFAVHCLGDEPASLILPLDGVQLAGDVLVDGVGVLPQALPASAAQPGYSLEVRGRGAHKVEMRFRVPIVATGEDRCLQLSVPPLLQSHLTWHLPATASYPRALLKQGTQWETAEPAGKRFEVDLGRVTGPVQLAWHEPPQPRRTPQLQLKSAYLWDLDVAASTLTALLSYGIQDGSVNELVVKLPPELEVRSADAYRPLAPAAPAPKPAAGVSGVSLRDWKVVAEQGARFLRLELPYPVTGEVQVLLELVPRRPLPADVTLPLPEPQGRPLPEQQFLAYRVGPGLNARMKGWLRLSGIPVERFAPFWSSYPRREQPLAYACTVHQQPRLSLHLDRQAPRMQAAQEITLRVGARLAEVQAVLDLSLPAGEGVGLVEWELQSSQPVTVANVAGTGLRGWKQTGGRVLVWLDQMRRDVKLEMSAWMPLAESAGGKAPAFDLPCLHVRGAQTQTTRLHLIPLEGLALQPLHLEQLRPLRPADNRGADLDQRLSTTRASYRGRFEVIPAAAQVAARILTFAELRDRRLTFTSTVDFQGQAGELRRLRVRLRGWEGRNVELQVSGGKVVRRSERQRASGEHLWDLDLEAGPGSRKPVLTLTGSMAVERATAGVPMPDVDVPDGKANERWLAVATRELAADARGALERQGVQALGPWPGVAERLRRTPGEVWKVGGPEWQLRLAPSDRGVLAAPVRVFLQEHSLAVIDGRHWLHEAVYWLHHESHTDLSVRLPARARVVAVSVDGVVMTPLQPQPVHLWLPLPGRPGVRCVTLRWLYEAVEPLAQPNLECPRIEGALAGMTLGTVLTPPGWEVLGGDRGSWVGTGAARLATLNLFRAEAHLQVCRALASSLQDGAAAALVEARERFDQCCEQADQALRVGGLADRPGPRGETLESWLRRLRKEREALSGKKGSAAGTESSPPAEPLATEEASRLATLQRGVSAEPADDLWQYGTPISWQTGPTETAPRVQLRSLREQGTRQALFVSGEWLGGLLLVALVGLMPFGRTLLRLLWPEQVLLLAVLGWWLAGPTLIVLLLLLLSVSGRVAQVIRSVRTLFRRRAARTDLAHNLLGQDQ